MGPEDCSEQVPEQILTPVGAWKQEAKGRPNKSHTE